MKKSEYMKYGFLSAAGTFAYTFGVAIFLGNARFIFGEQDSILTPVFMLLLLIISASLTGFMVLGRPIQLFLDGRKREAFILFFGTLGWLLAFVLFVAIIMIIAR